MIMSSTSSTFTLTIISCSAESRSSSRPPRIGLPKPSTSTNYSSSAYQKSNFAPVDEIGEPVHATVVHGSIPPDFPEGAYIRIGSNPLHRAQKSAVSVFGKSSHIWVEGEGMIHALYFNKDDSSSTDGSWTTFYNNKYVSTDTFELEKQRKKPVFLPATEGDPPAVLAAFLLNLMRFGVANKNISNTNVFEHAGKYYTSGDSDVAPHEIDIQTLETLGTWDEIAGSWNRPFTSHPKMRFGAANKNMSNTNVFEHAGKYYSITEIDVAPYEIDIQTLETLGRTWDEIAESWNRQFTSHPKKAPGTGELVIMGIDGRKPYLVLGVISADGKKLLHKVDMKFERIILFHEMGVTQKYNIIPDFPTIIDTNRLLRGGSLIRYEKDKYARIGVMPRYGDVDSVRWFEVKPCCAFHIINCYEEDDEVVVMACIAQDSIIPGPDLGKDKMEWFSRGFKKVSSYQENMEEGFLFARPYEWRLNMKTGQVNEKYLVPLDFAMDFPTVNDHFIGVKNKFAYTQVVDSAASSAAGMVKYGGLAKLSLQERNVKFLEGEDAQEYRKIEYHMFPENTFCTGASFVAKHGSADEDDGWLVTFVHNEDTNTSEVYIVDAKNISSEAVARIRLPCRVPYGFHGAYMPLKRD
ncbi:UNVERIFIED_CONTAM: Carotenoid 9,10(9',10')-cleavage dioxygenase 1 [Sesamum radiatum]|uniref:Carotenoid 9,10(9',10')-cleavage dioxygenase 1 n=1 Tax=Sesamum radiatum TaxID=300843 RepID=A0AAW2KZL5_SESRA